MKFIEKLQTVTKGKFIGFISSQEAINIILKKADIIDIKGHKLKLLNLDRTIEYVETRN